MTVRCADCGEWYGVGQWYACPHDPVSGVKHPDVTWPGGKTFENLSHEPQTFYSPAEQQRYLATHHLESFVRHTPVPGTDKSPHTTRWSAMSQDTLDGAAAMLARVGKGRTRAESYVRSMTVDTSVESGMVRENPHVA